MSKRTEDKLLACYYARRMAREARMAESHAAKGDIAGWMEHTGLASAIGMCAVRLIASKTNRKAPVARPNGKDGSRQGLANKTLYKGKGKK